MDGSGAETQWRTRPLRFVSRLARRPTADLRSRKPDGWACVLVAATVLVVLAYYMNHPMPDPFSASSDSAEYLSTARRVQTDGQFVDPRRLPGFPLLITLAFTLAGQGNLTAVTVANALLFILASVEIYVIATLTLGRGWVAFLIGMLVGTNVVLLSFVKPIATEALALWLVVSLTLATVLFVLTLRARHLWLAAAFMLGLCLTRGEWIGLAVPLFAYLILLVAPRGAATRRLLFHAVLSIALLYLVLGGYIAANVVEYHFVGMTDTQNVQLWGKVLQYHMQGEAPSKYAVISRIANTYRPGRGPTPLDILKQHPLLSRNHYALAAEFARATIERHPFEFLAKSVPVALLSLKAFYYESIVSRQGPFGVPLLWMQSLYRLLYRLTITFPVFAGAWIYMLFWRRTAGLRSVQAMGAIVLITLYGWIIVVLTGYDAYIRYYTPFYPLVILVIWGGLLAAVRFSPPAIISNAAARLRSHE